jgi:hypothetical protein
MRMLHIRRMAFPLRFFKQHPSFPTISISHPSVFVCLSATKDYFGYPLGPFVHLSLRPCFILLVFSVVSCPGLPSCDISLTTVTIMIGVEIVWLRDPNSITALHTKLLPTFRLMDSLCGTVLIFCYGLDLWL